MFVISEKEDLTLFVSDHCINCKRIETEFRKIKTKINLVVVSDFEKFSKEYPDVKSFPVLKNKKENKIYTGYVEVKNILKFLE